MVTKIRRKDVHAWLQDGNIARLSEYWGHPEVMAYRKNAMVETAFRLNKHNAWAHDVRNGDTFVFLMDRDEAFRNAHRGLVRANVWNELFNRIHNASWALLDIAPGKLKKAHALETLDRLTRVNQCAQESFVSNEDILMLQGKLHAETQGFYRRFQAKGALTAIAWIDNRDIWIQQRPRMANMMRYAASHNPNDVLGAYLVWACDAGCKGPEGHKLLNIDKDESLTRMQQLRILAERVGLDTSSYDEHAYRCKKLYKGLGMELNGHNILLYVQSTNMPPAPLANEEDLGALFI